MTCNIVLQAAITTQIYVKALKRADGTGSKADIVSMVCVPGPIRVFCLCRCVWHAWHVATRHDACPVQVAKDCRKIADAVSSLQFLWSGVFEAIVIFAILLAFTEYNALPAVAVFCFLLPCQYKLGLWIAHKKAEISGKSSERAQLTEEILRAMKLIKTYAWEDSFIEKLTSVREQEVALYGRQTLGKTFLIASVFQMPPLFVMAIFGVYQINNKVTGALAFTTLTLFNTLRLPLVKLPKSLRDCTDAFLAIERIERYLLEPEIDGATNGTGVWSAGSASALPRSNSGLSVSMAPGVVMFENASFGHQYKNSIPYLAGMNLNLAPGSLTMVAGSVGMGKSSFLKSILGQLHSVSGEHFEGGPFSYVPQSPWCALGTVRENILFGKAYNPEFYEKVCFACSLETDFKLFKNGDLTWIGERGGNLSGGQKQRIALARACYAQSAITVLDSPLSAVDMHTCQHIFKHCIQELMVERGITVVLATHQVSRCSIFSVSLLSNVCLT
jgi:ABC-type multidrug transport system fused ATPase/permease subunit